MKESYDPLENELYIDHENVSKSDEDFKKLIEKLEKSGSGLVEILKKLSEEERNQIDTEILNPENGSWGLFNGIEKDDEDRVLELLSGFIKEVDKEKRKIIKKELIKIIS